MIKTFSCIQSLGTYLKEYKFVTVFRSNKNSFGFKEAVHLSNQEPSQTISPDKNYMAFINYDYKNSIEHFPAKNNNPLAFPAQLFIESEKIIDLESVDMTAPQTEYKKPVVTPTVSRQQYIENVNALKQHIQLGDIYEINYCITFEAHHATIDPLALYQKLNAISNASFSAFAKLDHQYIICSSPELFLSKNAERIITKPIKGTARRGLTVQEDEQLKTALQNNAKERNENVMIVDVARNDLSRIAQRGTVNADTLFNIESYQQVHQMVSTVSCLVKENTTFNDIIEATFPMASMTGAPKYRAMQLIEEYEVYNRGPYSGALGYIDAKGDFDLSVLIRSVFYDEEKHYLSFTVGSAITDMCQAEEEYEECLLKAKAMIQALEG